jgi:two-component system chemotaxis response regulator CheB
MIVDDSIFMRQVISRMLWKDPDIRVVGMAVDGLDALEKVKLLEPDVITMDIEMPRMDGLTCLKRIMAEFPRPVVIVSSWAVEGAEYTLKALELGAIDFITKPSAEPCEEMWNLESQLIEKVKAAATVKIDKLTKPSLTSAARPLSPFTTKSTADNLPQIVAIGASTGGPRAIQSILTQLPGNLPVGVIVAQHMPKDFTKVFSSRLNSICELSVREAKSGDVITPGEVLVAPSGYQTMVKKENSKIVVEVLDIRSLYKPSVDFLFQSLAKVTGARTVAALLTGMGGDGARGLKALHDLGARTITEAEETCVVYGMPKVAWEMGAGEFSLPLPQIPAAILSLLQGVPEKAKEST